eukprot:GAHX01003375.1.p1 GENE.GAHX01003375.1~~GAHX01003375.1.p1  ORF type:complete len:54 (+),score=9.62 GAHX01003375.1:370-531(+)
MPIGDQLWRMLGKDYVINDYERAAGSNNDVNTDIENLIQNNSISLENTNCNLY